jgi:hypothetical protein
MVQTIITTFGCLTKKKSKLDVPNISDVGLLFFLVLVEKRSMDATQKSKTRRPDFSDVGFIYFILYYLLQ